jgi:hypothetical protein
MATMLKYKKEGVGEVESKESSLTPEYIQSKLFSLSDIAHKLHLDTKSYAEHKALGKLYEGLVGFRDEISEKIMGYQKGKRIGKLRLEEIPEYTEGAPLKLANDVIDFAYELYEWSGEKHYCDIENISQSLSGLGSQTVYLLTLK